MNGANPANPFGGSGERCNVGDGDVRFAILSREYMLDLPMTHDSMAVAFYNVSPDKKGMTRSGTHDCEVHFGMSRIEKGLFDQTAPCFLVDDGDRNMMDQADLTRSGRSTDVVTHQGCGLEVVVKCQLMRGRVQKGVHHPAQSSGLNSYRSIQDP